MKSIEQESQTFGPYSDLHTRNIVLQTMSNYPTYSDEDGFQRRELLETKIETLTGMISPDNTIKGRAFQHTSEYYAAIEDERERMEAYRGLTVVSTLPSGEDAEIEANPFKFLYLPEDATLSQTRDAWIMLSRKYFPDYMKPENEEQYRRIFGISEFPIDGKNYSSWLKEIQSAQSPETISAEKLAQLNPQEQDDYQNRHNEYRKKEEEYENVKKEMRIRAGQKLQIINKAYEAAKKRFSQEIVASFTGFTWKKEKLSGASGLFNLEYEVLNLEGYGQIRRDRGKWANDNWPYLSYDIGHTYLAGGDDFRQFLDLRAFFAWTELRQGKGLCPTLLDDLTETYHLDDDRSEQLRLMILNHEKSSFILTAHNIPTEGMEHYPLVRFLATVYEGPRYFHLVGPRIGIYYPLGVEFTPDDSLILKYEAQEQQGVWGGGEKQITQFTQLDVQMMRAMAYGPLLQEPRQG